VGTFPWYNISRYCCGVIVRLHLVDVVAVVRRFLASAVILSPLVQ